MEDCRTCLYSYGTSFVDLDRRWRNLSAKLSPFSSEELRYSLASLLFLDRSCFLLDSLLHLSELCWNRMAETSVKTLKEEWKRTAAIVSRFQPDQFPDEWNGPKFWGYPRIDDIRRYQKIDDIQLPLTNGEWQFDKPLSKDSKNYEWKNTSLELNPRLCLMVGRSSH